VAGAWELRPLDAFSNPRVWANPQTIRAGGADHCAARLRSLANPINFKQRSTDSQ